jgi:photosystem II stability/assembly factor-like uncharacterized protein
LCTGDGGNSWVAQSGGTDANLKCVHFATAAQGWIGGWHNSIGVSTNGGTTWTWQHPAGDSTRIFMALSFIDATTGWVADNLGGILHTLDGGKTWTPQSSGTSWAITSIQFLDTQEGWATATNRVVLHTTNGGISWTSTTLDALNYGSGPVIYEDIYFINRSLGWIATNSMFSETIVHSVPIVGTSDAGRTWSCQGTPESDFITGITFINNRTGWAAASRGILYTPDAGAHWTYQVQAEGFVDLCIVEQSRGWALTYSGDIYRNDTM